MEDLRQALGAVYVALAEAAGGHHLLDRANAILVEALDSDAIDAPGAKCILESLVHGTRAAEIDPTETAA